MKRIEAMNGYTIYQMTKRDINNEFYNATEGNYCIYLSSDIREYGRTNSTPEFEDIETIEECHEICGCVDAIAIDIAKINGGQDTETIEAIENVLKEAQTANNVLIELVVYSFDTDETRTEYTKYNNVLSKLEEITDDDIMLDSISLVCENGYRISNIVRL